MTNAQVSLSTNLQRWPVVGINRISMPSDLVAEHRHLSTSQKCQRLAPVLFVRPNIIRFDIDLWIFLTTKGATQYILTRVIPRLERN